MRHGAGIAILIGVCQASGAAGGAPEAGLRTEVRPVDGGAELITVFSTVREASGKPEEAPVMSVLRDTLGDQDPANDKLRYVWLHADARRPLGRKILAALPFLYLSGGKAPSSANRPPEPLLDLGKSARSTWHGLLWQGAQSFWLDPSGVAWRAPTRSFRGNAGDMRKTRLAEAAFTLARLERGAAAPGPAAGAAEERPALSRDELQELQARLLLSGTLLGGLVNDRTLPKVYERDSERSNLNRGRNWELLRQRAEQNRLYFEPLGGAAGDPRHVMLWVAKSDLQTDPHPFDRKFLGIADPWRDPRVKRWAGYTETWHFDAANRKLAPGVEGVRSEEMIPLALYGLDFPKAPLLMVDFRDQRKPRKRDLRSRATADVTRGVLGLSRIAHWELFAAQAVVDFVSERWGAAVSRPARIRAYAGLREFVRADPSLRPGLRAELMRRVTAMSTNPLDYTPEGEAPLARSQYAALEKRAGGSQYARRIEKDREEELTRIAHGLGTRAWLHVAHAATLGLYTHKEKLDRPLIARLDRERRIAYCSQLLRQAAGSGPRLEVAWDPARVRASAIELRRLTEGTPEWHSAAPVLSAVEPMLPQPPLDSIQAGE